LKAALHEQYADQATNPAPIFRTGPEFVPVLPRQRDHARAHGQISLTPITRITPDRGRAELPSCAPKASRCSTFWPPFCASRASSSMTTLRGTCW
jgi:hypothetical protein